MEDCKSSPLQLIVLVLVDLLQTRPRPEDPHAPADHMAGKSVVVQVGGLIKCMLIHQVLEDNSGHHSKVDQTRSEVVLLVHLQARDLHNSKVDRHRQ